MLGKDTLIKIVNKPYLLRSGEIKNKRLTCADMHYICRSCPPHHSASSN